MLFRSGRKQEAIIAVPHAFGEACAVIERAHGHTGPEEIRDLHGNVESGRGTMQTEAEISAADDARVVFGLQPARAQVDAPRRQPGEAALELGATRAVARHEDHEIREAASRPHRLPAANVLLEPRHGIDDDVEILILGPARRTHDEADEAAADTEAREERLTVSFAIRALERREDRRRPVVEDARLPHAEAAFEERRQTVRDAEVRVDAPGIVPLEPARETHRRMPAPEPQPQQRVAGVV